MRTRTRILIFLGLLAAAVGVVLVRTFPARPRVDIGFARYTDDGVAVLLKKFNQSTTQRWEKPALATPETLRQPCTAGSQQTDEKARGGCTIPAQKATMSNEETALKHGSIPDSQLFLK